MQFVYRLALARGCSVATLLRDTSASEMAHWKAYSCLSPFGEERADFRNAMLMAQIASMFGPKKGRRPKVSDFLPKFAAKKRKQTPEEMWAILTAVTKATGGTIN